MRTVYILIFSGALAVAQDPGLATMKQLMLDLIHPASNELLLLVNRGGPSNEGEWAEARRSALTLAESAALLAIPGRARDQADWAKYAKVLSDAGIAAYKAAQAKDSGALAVAAIRLDVSCTNCHTQFRPNVFPRGGGGSR